MLKRNGRDVTSVAYLGSRLFAAAVVCIGAAAELAPAQAPMGMPRRWEAGMQVSPYSTVNLRTGRMITTLPIVGWEGRGPSISFSLYHNMTSAVGALPLEGGESAGLMGDANGDNKVDEADIDSFAEIVLSESQSSQEVAITDFSGDGASSGQDLEGFSESMTLMAGGPNWRHSYSISITFASEIIPPFTVIHYAHVTRDDGTKDTFVKIGNDWVPPAGVFQTLVQESIGGAQGYTLNYKNQWRARFNTNGVLQWIADATTATDANGLPKNRVRCTYYNAPNQPHNGKLWKVIDAANRELVLAYNQHGKLMTITDPVDRVWTLSYEDGACVGSPSCPQGGGDFVALQDPNPSHPPITWSYTQDDEIFTISDKNGDPYTCTYDDGRLVAVEDSLTLDQAFTYYATEEGETKTRHYDRRGSEWQYWFKPNFGHANPTDLTANLTRIVNPLGDAVKYLYEDLRNPGATPPSNAPDNWYAPHRHEVTTRVNAFENPWGFKYAPIADLYVNPIPLHRGNLGLAEDPLGNAWTLAYDEYNNLTSMYEPEGEPGTADDILTTVAYNSSIDPTVPTSVTLPPDAEDQTGTITLTYWDASAYGGNANGKLRSVVDANGVETLFRYDTRGQLSRIDEGPITEAGSWWKIYSFASRNKVGQTLTARHYGSQASNSGQFETVTCAGGTDCAVTGVSITFDSCTCSASIQCSCVDAWIPPCPEREDTPQCPASGGSSSQTTSSVTAGYLIPRMCEAQNVPSIMRGDTFMTRDNMGRVTQSTSAATDESFPLPTGGPLVSTTQTIDYDGLGRPILSQLTTDEPRGGEISGTGITRASQYGYDDLAGIYTRTGPDGQTTTVQTDLAGRVFTTARDTLVALYDYYANGQVQSVTYNNGTLVSYEYDDAERLTAIRHQNLNNQTEPVILELTYGYNARGLITSIGETAPGQASTVTTFAYDKRGRLIVERRIGSHEYWLSYSYDQGGNRKLKIDHVNGATTSYHYDTDTELVDCDGDGDADTAPKDCYHTRHNRLMYYETLGATIREKVWYQYDLTSAAAGNPTYIVRQVYNAGNPFAPPVNYGYVLNYNSSGELWFISKQTWTGHDCPPEAQVTQSIHEFRTSGRAMRLTRERDPQFPNVALAGTTQWHDFDGDEAYADSSVSVAPQGGPVTLTALHAREPGIGMKDVQTGDTSYFHGDQIGSLRAVTDTPAGTASVTGRVVYTAFGERVWSDGTIGTRHQYAGAWGYDTMPEFASGMSPHFDGEPGDDVPFVHVGHRWYDPASGRFLQRDPIGIRGGLNVYGYSTNTPTVLVDPTGLTIITTTTVETRRYTASDGSVWVATYMVTQTWDDHNCFGIGIGVGVGGIVAGIAGVVITAPVSGALLATAGLCAGVGGISFAAQPDELLNTTVTPLLNVRVRPPGSPPPMPGGVMIDPSKQKK